MCKMISILQLPGKYWRKKCRLRYFREQACQKLPEVPVKEKRSTDNHRRKHYVFVNAEITADGAGGRLQGVGSTEHLTSSGNGLLALPNHGNDGSAEHVIAKLGEEGLVHEVAVVSLEKLLAGHASLHGGQLVSLCLESGDDIANNTTLNTIGLDLFCKTK